MTTETVPTYVYVTYIKASAEQVWETGSVLPTAPFDMAEQAS